MNKDSLIAAVFGVLLGFIAGYLMHEVMESRQPQRLVAGAAQAGVPGMPGMQPAMPGAGPASGGAPQPADQSGAQAQAQQEMQSLQQYIQQNPNDADAIRRLADLSYEQALWPQARELYTRFLEIQPGNPDVISDLGVVYRGLGEPDKALSFFDEAQRLQPQHWQSRYNEVLVLIDQKKFDEAGQVMGELKMLQPGNPNVDQLEQELQKRKAA